jgi:DNA-3-methyladenine glycosylase II
MNHTHAALFSKDPLLYQLVMHTAPLPEPSSAKPIYEALLSSIISQQLSVKAAATIKKRFFGLFPGEEPDPAFVLALPLEELRAVGLSGQKAGYIKSVATHKSEGKLEDQELAHLPDEELLARLVQIKGVGRWTAEMILMFALHRPDVMPVDDLGIYNAMKRLYHFEETGKPAKAKMLELSQAWRPHRTLACRYLWHSLDNMPLTSPES